MSKLDELLQGVKVEWLPLGDVCKIIGRIGYRGYTKKDIVENKDGAIALSPSNIINDKINYEKLTFINWDKYYESPEIMIHNGDIIFCKTASVGKTAYVEDLPYLATLNPQLVVFKEIKCLSKFLSYCLKTENFKISLNKIIGLGSVPSISQKDLSKLKIPIPCPDNPEKSLEIQQEIVRVLDELTTLTNQLTTELETERQNRKKQFEFFREQLFRFEEKEVKYISLGELSKIGDGLHGTPKYNDSGNYYFINGNNLNSGEILITDRTKKVDDNTYNKYGIEFSKNKTIFLSINGTIGSVSFYNDEKIVLGKSVAYFNIISNELLHKYLYYIFQIDFSKNYFEKNKTGSTIKNLGLKALRSFKIPIPSLEEQERIVKILDQFDATHTAIEEEITKEIKLRTQQYEYYREKLLSFPSLRTT